MARVYLVGAGPGDVDLLTLRAARLIERADLIFYDALVNPDILALATGRTVSVGKRCGAHSTAQRFINRQLVAAAAKYSCVVRLKGGDPMLFARAQEEIDVLVAAGIDVEVVPGVTSALAAAAGLGISLTRRAVSRSVTFVTPRVGAEEDASDWVKSVLHADTAVLYMAGHEAPRVAQALIAAGRAQDWPVAIVASAGTPQMQSTCTTLGRLASNTHWQPFAGPTLLCMGDVFAGLEAIQARSLSRVKQG